METILTTVFIAMAISSILFVLFCNAFPNQKNLEEKGRINMRLGGSGLWRYKRIIEEYVEEDRRSQALVLFLISRISFVLFVIVFIINLVSNIWV